MNTMGNINTDPGTWQLEYRDTVKLLQEKLLLFVRVNAKLRDNIRDISRFVNNTAAAIEIDLEEFSESYKEKFIAPDLQQYCMRFIGLLKNVLAVFVREIGYGAYGFIFRFRSGKDRLELTETVFADYPKR